MDAVEGVADVVRHRVGVGDGVGVGLDLDGLVAAGGADELPDRPPSRVFEASADVQGSEGDREVGFDLVVLVVVDRPGLPSCLDIRNDSP